MRLKYIYGAVLEQNLNAYAKCTSTWKTNVFIRFNGCSSYTVKVGNSYLRQFAYIWIEDWV